MLLTIGIAFGIIALGVIAGGVTFWLMLRDMVPPLPW